MGTGRHSLVRRDRSWHRHDSAHWRHDAAIGGVIDIAQAPTELRIPSQGNALG